MKRFLSLNQQLLLSTLLLGSFVSVSQAQPTKISTTKKAKAPRKSAAIKRAEAIAGRPLTEAQIKAIQAAMKERSAAMKPIMAKFNASVAKTLGLSVPEFEKRLKASRAAERAKAKAKN